MAKELMTWCHDAHKEEFVLFAQWLLDILRTCFMVSSRTARLRIEKMWEQYYVLRVSKPFKEKWENFFQTSSCQCALPTVCITPNFQEIVGNGAKGS